MTRRILLSPFGRAAVLALGLALILTTQSSADKTDGQDSGKTDKSSTAHQTEKKATASTKKKKKRLPLITHLKVDPKAQHVPLFEGINGGSLNVKLVAQDSFNGSLFIENRSQKPLTVEMPEAFVGVQVLRQFGGGAAGGRGAAGGAAGGAQTMGGGMGGGMGGMGGGMGGMGGGMGGGMFSVPPERTAKVSYHSVCLEHGKNDPDPTVNYKIVPVEEFTKDDQLTALLTLVGSKAIDPQVAQAAAWHLSNKMSWEELANKRSNEIGESDLPYFSPQALGMAEQLVTNARILAHEKAEQRAKAGDTKKKQDSASDPHVIQGR
jgi:hypothetical protein